MLLLPVLCLLSRWRALLSRAVSPAHFIASMKLVTSAMHHESLCLSDFIAHLNSTVTVSFTIPSPPIGGAICFMMTAYLAAEAKVKGNKQKLFPLHEASAGI